MARSIELLRRPEARTESVEDLIAAVLRGEVRIPEFQRGLEWRSSDVLDLFDSIYHGFPIGSLLLRRAPALAGAIQVGPVPVFGIETRAALWVVDGQQRLTSLVAGLGRPGTLPTTPEDPFVVYFDPTEQQFRAPLRNGPMPSTWVPVPQLLDAAALNEWVYAWSHGKDDDLRRVIFEVGRRLREYRVPLYVIDTDDEEAVRKIFYRVNSSGKPLAWNTVHDALYGRKGKVPSTLGELAQQLDDVGMGQLDEETQLLPCLLALRGLDVTRTLAEHLQHDPRALEDAVVEALPVLRRVLGFLRTAAEIQHMRLLPNSAPLVVLTRYFKCHPEPNDRTTTLLTRWVWRCFLGLALSERTLKRRGVASVTDDEEASVQNLLSLVRHSPNINFLMPDSFDARSAQSRLALLGMASCKPRKLGTNDSEMGAVDIAAWIRDADRDAFRPLFPLSGGVTSSPANRVLLPGKGPAVGELRSFIERYGCDHPLLESHAINGATAQAIVDDDAVAAIGARTSEVDGLVEALGDRLAEWGRSDRPSLAYLLAQVTAP